MANKSERRQSLDELRKLASQDSELLDVIDFINKTTQVAGESNEPRILMPYVSAPGLTEHTWK